MTDTLSALEDLVAATADRVGPATVSIGRHGRGSGMVVERDRVLTNAHNLRDRTTSVRFADGRTEQGTVVGADPDGDLVVLDVPTGDTPPVEWADAPPAVGAVVVAVAAGPQGTRVSQGVVSGTGRTFRGPGGRAVSDAVEHTAPLARGSTGGPLVDRHGRVVGVTTLRPDGGFALARAAGPALRRLVRRLAGGADVRRPALGVTVAGPEVAARLRAAVGLPERTGLLVREVAEASPAAAAGLSVGDLLVAADGRDLDDVEVLHAVLDAADGPFPVDLLRGADELRLEVDLTA